MGRLITLAIILLVSTRPPPANRLLGCFASCLEMDLHRRELGQILFLYNTIGAWDCLHGKYGWKGDFALYMQSPNYDVYGRNGMMSGLRLGLLGP